MPGIEFNSQKAKVKVRLLTVLMRDSPKEARGSPGAVEE